MPASKQTTARPLVIASVMLSMFMIAIEATIVSTAMPQIVGELGGLTLYSWVFSAFLLTQTVATVVFGKLSDVYGRKPMLLAGIGVFLLGSLGCGFAWSMPSLIAFRLVQGIGAGAMQPVGLTLVGDLYAAEERGRIQGALASVWAISAVLGPVVGALIIAKTSWAWIFWLNVPIGILAALGFVLFLREDLGPVRSKVDVPGALLFTVAMGALMTALTESGSADATVAAAAGAVAVVAAALFVWWERRAAEPMISFELWSRRPIAAANGASLLAGMALIGLTTFLPMYVQGVMRQTPVVAGLALTVMVLGWPVGATFAARSFARFGLKPLLAVGAALVPTGAVAFLMLTPEMPPALAGAGSLVMGLGMGLLSTSSIVLIQEIVSWSERGSATASNLFSRNLGSTLGAAVFGAVLNHGLARPGATSPIGSEELQKVLASGQGSAALDGARALLQGALHNTFWAVFLISCGAAAVALLVPHVPLGRQVRTSAT
ncbi:MAG: major facilitator superfamily 1 [Enterovirga sp.]|nr:major facilitator superfamily 1 [Enterovirga sp.]